MKLIQHQYGKAHVRVLKVLRSGRHHSLKELDVSVGLQGEFDASYTRADNRIVVATDSMRNTVNVLARKSLRGNNEKFGMLLARHFLDKYRHVKRVEIHLSEHCWNRIPVGGRPHAHSFSEKSPARPFARIVSTRKETRVESGITDLLILKTTGSGFEKFLRDEFTTLPETADRIFSTKLTATWTYRREPKRYQATNEKVVGAMMTVFARDYSPSVQVTLYAMGKAALKAVPELSKVHLVMPNKHCLLVDLAPFGLENRNDLFVPTDEPHGLIEGTVAR
jgi:urate oxidase